MALSGGRRIAGFALPGCMSSHVLAILAPLSDDPIPDIVALVPKLSGQMLLAMLNLGLIAGPAERAQTALRRIALRNYRRSDQTLRAVPDLPAQTTSMCVATVAPGETDRLEAIARADRALCVAEASGRDCVAAGNAIDVSNEKAASVRRKRPRCAVMTGE